MAKGEVMAIPRDVLDGLYETFGEHAVMMLTTVAPEGYLRTRPMELQPRDEQIAEFWFATSPETHKVSDIEQHPQVCLSYYDPSGRAYVSIAGRAELTANRGEVQRVWNERMRPWFPQGPDDPAIMLLRVQPTHIEYWEAGKGPLGVLWEEAKAVATGERPEMPPVRRLDVA